jgi:hypothetical protein
MSWNPFSWISKALINKYASSIIRQVLTALGTYLIAKGYATPEAAEHVTKGLAEILLSDQVLGALLNGTAFTWSMIDKAKNQPPVTGVR